MDKKGDGPTVFDINRPNTYGASPSARPVITGHQPTMPDPMVKARDTAHDRGSKITVSVDNEPDSGKKNDDLGDGIDTAKLADAMFSEKPAEEKPAFEEPSGPPAILEGEPQMSPPFTPDVAGKSSAQRAPYMPVSDLTGIGSGTPAKAGSEISDSQVTTGIKPAVFGSHSDPSNKNKPTKHKKSSSKIALVLAILLVALASLYAAIDKGLILSSVDLPFHIFEQEEKTAETVTPPAAAQPTVPAGFTATKLVEANLGFNYPTAWGAPTAAADMGFTERKSGAKPDVNYAFVVDFPDNKDVQLAVTSGKYLPPARTALYYDILGWCVGTADGKYYGSVLRYSTSTDKTDTPSTITCDQILVGEVTKISNDTIVQANIKNDKGESVGDIYTRNLTGKDYVVARVVDATIKNSDQIKLLLESIKPL